MIASVQKPCFKRQSEELFPELDRLMEETALKPEDIDEVVITEGPGSYTGVRIAMTAAKVFCALKDRPIYTLGTLQLYAGNTDNCRVILDARGKRAYTAVYSGGNIQGDIAIEYCQDIKIPQGQTIVGDKKGYRAFFSSKPRELASSLPEMRNIGHSSQRVSNFRHVGW